MEKKELTTVNPVTVAGVTVVPVSRVRINGWHGRRGVAIFGSKQPVGVIIVSPSAKRAFRITGEEISLEQLAEENPEIAETLREI